MKNKRAFSAANKEIKLEGLLSYGYRDLNGWYCLGENFFNLFPKNEIEIIKKNVSF